MRFNNRHYIVAVITLIVSFVLVLEVDKANSYVGSSLKMAEFPRTVGKWQSQDLELSADTYDILGTKDVLLREYSNDKDQTVVLAIVYSDTDRSSFHPPEICYLGGGVELLEKRVEELTLDDGYGLKVNALTMKSKENVVKAWYWFAAGETFTHSFYLQQLNLLLNWMRYKARQGALIRVSVRLDPQGSTGVQEAAGQFIKEIKPLLEKFLKNT
jgi:EpsI family protein